MGDQNFTAAIDALRDELNAKIDAQIAEAKSTRWMVGVVMALLAILTGLCVLNTVFGLMGGP